ncbi:hypothetical protein [Kineosporia succinea]|uniref:Lipoprotein n=1 Tax=Kineosporia succinea TaxID=84632 RepID=A0ABT9PCA6_9ACTN|nr:hypothetical protein [Kineosporia succinea]MDP9830332.1 hypothetical protein [Kineosporia succinea]
MKMRTAPTVAAVLIALTTTGALSACGGGSAVTDPQEQVAALPSSAAPSVSGPSGSAQSPPASATGTSGRPQLRLDDTEARVRQLSAAHADCLAENGARYATDGENLVGVDSGNGKMLVQPIPEKALRACIGLEPLAPVEMRPDSNPHYRENWQANVACLREHGLKVHLTQDMTDPAFLSWTYDEDAGISPDNQPQIEEDCMAQAFGSGR